MPPIRPVPLVPTTDLWWPYLTITNEADKVNFLEGNGYIEESVPDPYNNHMLCLLPTCPRIHSSDTISFYTKKKRKKLKRQAGEADNSKDKADEEGDGESDDEGGNEVGGGVPMVHKELYSSDVRLCSFTYLIFFYSRWLLILDFLCFFCICVCQVPARKRTKPEISGVHGRGRPEDIGIV